MVNGTLEGIRAHSRAWRTGYRVGNPLQGERSQNLRWEVAQRYVQVCERTHLAERGLAFQCLGLLSVRDPVLELPNSQHFYQEGTHRRPRIIYHQRNDVPRDAEYPDQGPLHGRKVRSGEGERQSPVTLRLDFCWDLEKPVHHRK